jgi:hypothetical protein
VGVFKIRGFEGLFGVPKHGGPLNSTRAGLLNHQSSKISLNSIWMKICLWVFKIREFEGGIWVPKHGGSLNSTAVGLLNHLTSKISLNSIWIKICLWVYIKFEGLEVCMGFPSMGDPLIPPGQGC